MTFQRFPCFYYIWGRLVPGFRQSTPTLVNFLHFGFLEKDNIDVDMYITFTWYM